MQYFTNKWPLVWYACTQRPGRWVIFMEPITAHQLTISRLHMSQRPSFVLMLHSICFWSLANGCIAIPVPPWWQPFITVKLEFFTSCNSAAFTGIYFRSIAQWNWDKCNRYIQDSCEWTDQQETDKWNSQPIYQIVATMYCWKQWAVPKSCLKHHGPARVIKGHRIKVKIMRCRCWSQLKVLDSRNIHSKYGHHILLR